MILYAEMHQKNIPVCCDACKGLRSISLYAEMYVKDSEVYPCMLKCMLRTQMNIPVCCESC